MRPIKDIEADLATCNQALSTWAKRKQNIESELHSAKRQEQARRKPREQQEAERIAKFASKIVPGDYVRLVGVRNTRYNWRKVISVTGSSVIGYQACRNRDGSFSTGYQTTENGLGKVVELVTELETL